MIGPRTFLVMAYAATAIPILSSLHNHLLGDKTAGDALQHVFARPMDVLEGYRATFWKSDEALSRTEGAMNLPPTETRVEANRPICGLRLTATPLPPTAVQRGCGAISPCTPSLTDLSGETAVTPTPTGKRDAARRLEARPEARPQIFRPRQTPGPVLA